MESVQVWLTVFFDEPFWVGIVQRHTGKQLEAAKTVFGAEPKDYEVYQWLLLHYQELRFSPTVTDDGRVTSPASPKRMQREAARQIARVGVGTKAQEALKLQQAEGKQARKTCSRQQKEALEQRLFALRQEKRREKHRGR